MTVAEVQKLMSYVISQIKTRLGNEPTTFQRDESGSYQKHLAKGGYRYIYVTTYNQNNPSVFSTINPGKKN